MIRLATYLCGSISDAKDAGTKWRDKITPKLEALGIVVLDPCKSECNQTAGDNIFQSKEQIRKYKRAGNFDAFDDTMGKIIHDDLKQTADANFLIVYWNQDYKHGGTVHEIVTAWNLHIPVYMVTYDTLTDVNDWVLALVRQNGQTFENFGQLMDFIEVRYKNDIKAIAKERESLKEKSQSEEKKDEKKNE